MADRPSTAVLLPPTSASSNAQQHDHRLRTQSQSATGRRERPHASKKRSANHVKSRPVNEAAMNAILESFDALTPPPAIRAHDHYPATGSSASSKRSRRYSSEDSLSTVPSIARSAGFGMEYGTGPLPSDDFEDSDAATPPVIRTSRSPSGCSKYQAPLISRMNSNGQLRPASVISRTSSRSSFREREGPVKDKHSADSLVVGQQSPRLADHESVDSGRSRRRSLRRMISHESLRPTAADSSSFSETADLGPPAEAERIIVKPFHTPVKNKERLYLNDDATVGEEKTEEQDELGSTIRDSGIDSALQNIPLPSSQPPSGLTTPRRDSPRKSPILDSIPTRTSSLRHTSNSPARGKKRDKKSKRSNDNAPTAESPLAQRSKTIPESTWADLGDDDETVRRIRQLQEQRKSRIEESKSYSSSAEPPPVQTYESPATPADELTSSKSEADKRASRVRPSANRALTGPPSKADQMLGIRSTAPMHGFTGTTFISTARTPSISPERLRHSHTRLEPNPHVTLYNGIERSGSTNSPTPPLSLEYSYAQAVDVLQNVDRELSSTKLHSRRPSVASVTLKALDLPPHAASRNASPAPLDAPQGPKRAAKRQQDRWTAQHPDLPLDSKSKNSRRKSMSDARRTRYPDDEAEPQRRDSIEGAVVQYLFAPRLNQKVKHPVTGRVISFSEVGDPEGGAVFVCVGMGLTRFVTAFYDELATTLRLRLITVDRPGVGASEPYPPNDRGGPLNWPDDILAICQHLNITKFSLLAHSAGAVYALATALILPQMIKGKVHLLAPWIPPSQLEAIKYPTASTPPAGALPRSQRLLRVLPTSFLRAANSSFMTATSASIKPANKRQLDAARAKQQRQQSMSPSRVPDRPSTGARPDMNRRESMMEMDQFMPTINPMENFPMPVKEEDEGDNEFGQGSLLLSATATPTDPNFTFASTGLNAAEHAERERKVEYTNRLTERTWELATRDSNPATDLLVCLERNREIGFHYTDVSREVIITHGTEDKRVPLGNVKWLCEQMNSKALAGMANDLAGVTVPPTRDNQEEPYSRGGCEVRVLHGEGHGLMASALIMSDVLTEISGYWIRQDKALFDVSPSAFG